MKFPKNPLVSFPIIWMLGCLSLSSCFGAKIDKIIAIVNETPITSQMLKQRAQMLKSEYQIRGKQTPNPRALSSMALDALIDTVLQLELATQQGISIEKDEVSRIIEDLAEQQELSPQAFLQKVQASGMNLDKYRAQLHQDLMLSRLHDQLPPVQVSEADVNRYLKQHPQLQNRFMEYRLTNVRVPVPAEPTSTVVKQAESAAHALLASARKLSNLERAADQYTDKDITPSFTDLGWRSSHELPDDFASAVTSMKQGDIKGPIQTPNGLHLIQLKGARSGGVSTTVTRYHLRQILIKTDPWTNTDLEAKKTIESVRRQIKRGTPFSQIAKEFSQDPNSASKGGELGWINDYELPPAITKGIENITEGDVSHPIQSRAGWHLIQVIKRQTADASKDITRRSAKQSIYQRKREAQIEKWLSELRASAYIKIIHKP